MAHARAPHRRPPPDRARDILTRIGMALVLGLMLLGLTNDIICR